MKRIALWLALATVGIAALSLPALAYTSIHLVPLTPYGDTFYNYDFDTQSAQTAYADFPVGIIWQGASGVTVSSVKTYIQNSLGPGYPTTGSTKYSYVSDGTLVWNADGGKMTNCYDEYGHGKKRHIRPYAPYDNHFYNATWGYYVISNMHERLNEPGCSGALYYGWSEDIEDIVLQEASADGYPTNAVYYNTQNYGEFWEPDGRHFQKSDGYAATILFW